MLDLAKAVRAEHKTPEPVTSDRIIAETRKWPAKLAEDAFIGPLGEYVLAIAENTEADPSAILLQCLVMFGSAVGRGPFFSIGSSATHHANEFVVIVGETSSGRKGTSFGDALGAFRGVDDEWIARRVTSGLSSGEGLIHLVRDAAEVQHRTEKKGRTADEAVADPGETDKRALIVESEFVNVLKQGERAGNTLTVILRQAWESGDLRTLTKNSPAKATGAHISTVAHITETELKKHLSEVETANGLGNRFLWVVSHRSKYLPDPKANDDRRTRTIRDAIRRSLEKGKLAKELRRDAAAQSIWNDAYVTLERDRAGIAGCLLARAAPHVIRLSLISALSEGASAIGTRHLTAAFALWEYSERSVQYLFGDSVGDSVAEATLALIRSRPEGVMRTEISIYHGRNLTSSRVQAALDVLLKSNLVRRESRDTAGRPAEYWLPEGGINHV